MNCDALTVGEIKQLAAMVGARGGDSPYEVGAVYFIRTVTHYLTGRLVAVTSQELVLEDAAWIADTGRFADALKNQQFKEVEPFPAGRVIVGRGAIVDAVVYGKVERDQQ